MRRNTSRIGLRKLCSLVITVLSFLTSVAKRTLRLQEGFRNSVSSLVYLEAMSLRFAKLSFH
jgi:hypothetical protein